jgi:putative endopeptidase
VSRGAGEGGARARGDLQGLSDVQLFFVYFAILWRAKSTKEIQETFLAVDPHSPSEFRVNGVLRNIDEFVDSFGVKEGDEMWLTLDKRVTIW